MTLTRFNFAREVEHTIFALPFAYARAICR